MQHAPNPSLFETYGTPGACIVKQKPRAFGLPRFVVIYLSVTLVLFAFGINSKASTTSMQHLVWPTSLQGAHVVPQASLPRQPDASHGPKPLGTIPPFLPQLERAPQSIFVTSSQPPTAPSIKSPSPVCVLRRTSISFLDSRLHTVVRCILGSLNIEFDLCSLFQGNKDEWNGQSP